MRRAPSLLELLQSSIERTYAMETGVRAIGRYVVGDQGYERIYGRSRIVEVVGSASSGPGARVLVRETSEGLHASIYYPDALIAELESANPLHGLDSRNLDAFSVFVEELDHFLTLADRARERRPVSLFELELHAHATKYVASRHFLARSLGRPLTAGEGVWLRSRLFEHNGLPDGPPELRERYRDADRLGGRYALLLDDLAPRARIAELRDLHRRPLARTVGAIEAASR